MSNSDKLYDTFASSLQISREAVSDDLEYNTIPEWDSVAHMALAAELEIAFDVMLETDDIIDMSSVGKAREILQKHGVSF